MTDDIPDPEITATPVTDDGQLSTSAVRLLAKIDPGWSIEIIRSRGPVLGATGQWTGTIADCVTVNLTDATGGCALACFLDGKYAGGLSWVRCTDCTNPGFEHPLGPPTAIGYRDLCRLVSAV